MKRDLKRVSLMIGEEQYNQIVKDEINLSGLVRDLIDDHMSEHKITLSVSKETKDIYDLIISNTGSTDGDLEVYLKDSLKQLLKDKIKSMQDLERKL